MTIENNDQIEDLPSNLSQQDIRTPPLATQQDQLLSATIGSEEWYSLLKEEPQYISEDVDLFDTYPFNPVCNEINQLITTFQGQGAFKLCGKEEKTEYPADYVLRKLLGSVVRIPDFWKEKVNEDFARVYFTNISYLQELHPKLLAAGFELRKYPQMSTYLQTEINKYSSKDFLRVSKHGKEIPTYARFARGHKNNPILGLEDVIEKINYTTPQNVASNLDTATHKGSY